MYTIYADDVCIYSDAFLLDNMKVVSPKLTLEDSAAGSLTLTLPPTNIGYDTITRMVTDISVRRDGEEIWEGRVLEESTDFYNNRVLTCEGALAFFNDTTQPPTEYHDMTVRGFLEALVAVHNAKVAENRQFTVGIVTVTDSNDSIYRYTNNEKTMECINEKLVNSLGGHLRVRREDGVRYLDYLADYPTTTGQKIEFGKNLLDFTRNWDMTDFATVILPLGNRLDESDIEALDAYLTVESVNEGSMYVENSDAVEAYGWIETVVNWDDVSVASNLLTKAKAYLADIQFDSMTIELSAVDLHYLDSTVEDVKLLDQIRVVSVPHGLDRYFPVTKLEIPLDEPENTKFTLGDDVSTTLTSVNNSTNTDILNKIENLPKASVILQEAKDNAAAIMNAAVTGYITIVQDEYGSETLYISEDRDYTASKKLWKWSLNGLGYSSDGGETYDLALTMDGAINGTMIAANSIYAESINVEYTQSIINEIDAVEETLTASIKTNADSITAEVTRATSAETVLSAADTKYGTCSTAASTAAKVVTCTDFTSDSLVKGTTIFVYFTYANTAASPTLNVNGTGAKSIYAYGAVLTASSSYNWPAKSYVCFVYSGSYWTLVDSGSSSKISVLADSISLSVTSATGGTASIVLSVDGTDTTAGTVVTSARTAFANETSSITISSGTITFSSNTLIVSSTQFKLTSAGNATFSGTLSAASGSFTGTVTTTSTVTIDNVVHTISAKLSSASLRFYYDDTEKGSFAGSIWSDTSYYGIAMHLTDENYFLSFSRDDDGDGTYIAAYYICYATSISSYRHNFSGSENHSGTVRFASAATFASTITTSNYIRIANGYAVQFADSSGTYRSTLQVYSSGNVYLGNENLANIHYVVGSYSILHVEDAFRPGNSNVISLGTSSYKWTQLYATSSTISTSDRNEKHDITDISEKYENFFNLLRGVTYMRNDGDRVHVGMISQEVLEALEEAGLTAEDFGGFCRDAKVGYSEYDEEGSPIESSKYELTDEDGNVEYSYALRYEEFIGLCIHMIQKLQDRVTALESAQ